LASFTSLSPGRLNLSIGLQVKGLASQAGRPTCRDRCPASQSRPSAGKPGQPGQPDVWPDQPFVLTKLTSI